MEIIFRAHNAVISDGMRTRTERLLAKLASRIDRPVDAIARFEQDGPTRRVELVIHGARGRRFVAEGTGRNYGPALAVAGERLAAQLGHGKRTVKNRSRGVRLRPANHGDADGDGDAEAAASEAVSGA